MKNLKFNDIYNMPCVDGMSLIPDDSVDLIVTDPPFAIDFKAKVANYNRKENSVLEGYKEIEQKDYFEFTQEWVNATYRILKDSGSMYIVSGWTNLKDILNAVDNAGFETVNHIIWKYQFGVVTKRKFVSSHYHILLLSKNDKKRKFFPYCRYEKGAKNSKKQSLHYLDKEDVWVINREYWNGDVKTPTKLPAELIKKMIQYSSEKDDLVFDPFLGSSQTAVVSKIMERQYIGFEIVEEYYKFGKERLDTDQYRIKENVPLDEGTNTLF